MACLPTERVVPGDSGDLQRRSRSARWHRQFQGRYLLIAEAYRQIGDFAEAFESAARALRGAGRTGAADFGRLVCSDAGRGGAPGRPSSAFRSNRRRLEERRRYFAQSRRLDPDGRDRGRPRERKAGNCRLVEPQRSGAARVGCGACAGRLRHQVRDGSHWIHRLACNWYAQLARRRDGGADAAAFTGMVAGAFFWNEGKWERKRVLCCRWPWNRAARQECADSRTCPC